MKWIILVSVLISSYSCKKNKSFKQDMAPKTEDQSPKIYLPVKFLSDRLEILFLYEGNSAILKEIKDSNGERLTITYQTDFPSTFHKYKYTNSIGFSDCEQTNTTIKISAFKKSGNLLTPTGHRLLTKNSTGQITNISHFGTNNVAFAKSDINYANGNPESTIIINLSSGTVNQFNYTYDDNNGIFKHVKHAQLILEESAYFFLHHTSKNILSYSMGTPSPDNSIYSYKYTLEKYPAELKVVNNNKIQTFKISYQEINP